METGASYYQQSYKFFNNGQIEESLEACKKALELGYNAGGNVQCSASYKCLVLKRYEDSITYADESLAIDPQNAIAYGNKGIALKELGRYQEAIQVLEKSLSIDPNNAFCWCHKASALNHLGREDEGLHDIKKAQEIMKENRHTTLLVESDKKFIMDTLDSVLGLQKSTQETEKIIASLDNNNTAVKKMVEKFTLLKAAKNKVTNRIIDTIGTNQSKSGEAEARKQNILASLSKNPSQVLLILDQYPEAYSYPETIPYLMRSMSDLQKETNSDVKEIKADVKSIKYSIEDLTADIKSMKKTMKSAGVYDKAKVREGFEFLYEESPLLHEYAKSFYWSLLNYFAAYRSINTQLVSGNTSTVSTKNEEYMELGIQKASSYLVDMAVEGTKSIPIVGNIISLLDGIVGSIYTAIKEKTLEDRVSAINYVIMKNRDPNALLEEDLSTSIALTALDIAMRKKADILNPKPENTNRGKREQAWDWLNTQINLINEAALGKGIDIYDSDAARAALADVLLLLAYLYKNYEIVCSKNQSLSEQFAHIVLTSKTGDMLGSACIETSLEPETSIPFGTARKEIVLDSNATRQPCCSLF